MTDQLTKPVLDFSFTTIIAVDEHHVKELQLVWPTWKCYKPELIRNPLLVVCDGDISVPEWNRKLQFLDHPDMHRVQWNMSDVSQREKMLNGITFAAAKYVHTPWFLKLDTDAVATKESDWVQRQWFSPNDAGEFPVFISQPWGYTKPPDAIDKLDQWARTIPELAAFQDLGISPEPGRNKVSHPRITSWCYFGNTSWTKSVLQFCTDRLPVPSHDTFLWYCAERQKRFYRKVRMTNYGWKHLGRFSTLQKHFRDLSHFGTTTKENNKIQDSGDTKFEKPVTEIVRKSEENIEKQGVLYLLCGVAYAVRMVVSIQSLRKHYSGRIILFTIGEESHEIGRRIANDQRLGVEHRQYPQTMRKKNSAYLHKLALLQDPPFEINAYLDADTLVTGSINELFDLSDDSQVSATQFATWTTERRTIRKRIKSWQKLKLQGRTKRRIERLVRNALKTRPAINCGVFGLRRNSPLTKKWFDLALIGRRTFICDEIAFQMLLHYHPHKLLDCRWNCSPIYAKDTKDVRVWHMHGSKHLRSHAVNIWWPAYQNVIAENFGQICDWTPSGDGRLEQYLQEQEHLTYD